MPAAKRPTTIDEYIAAAPPETQKKLREMRACIRQAAPGAEESLKWGMPAFSHQRILVMFAGFKHHIGFFPTPSPLKALAQDLKGFKSSKGGVQFPLEKALPLRLVTKITKFRVEESMQKDERWRTSRARGASRNVRKKK